jgi:flagellin
VKAEAQPAIGIIGKVSWSRRNTMQITNNVSAFNVWKNYTKNVKGLRQSMNKLSSGSRITNAGDDPAGLAMSERLRAQARNTNAAASNVENKLSYLQTADSWLQKIHDMLGRMSELAVMANDGTKSQGDRTILQREFEQMQKEIQRITSGATAAGKFNGLYLFRGGTGIAQMTGDGVVSGAVTTQVGADSGMNVDSNEIDLQVSNSAIIGQFASYSYSSNMSLAGSTITDVRWNELISSDGLSIASQGNADRAVAKMNVGIDYISETRAIMGAEMKRMEQTLDGLRNYAENISATESRIRDVDVAKETTEMSKFQILQQVGTAMLAQANQLSEGVMQLLG